MKFSDFHSFQNFAFLKLKSFSGLRFTNPAFSDLNFELRFQYFKFLNIEIFSSVLREFCALMGQEPRCWALYELDSLEKLDLNLIVD